MKIDGKTIIFSSGRTAYAYGGIVGIDDELGIYEGYDGYIEWPPDDADNPDSLTAEDMRELADYMIGLWSRFKETLV